jgi:hypothetical protein
MVTAAAPVLAGTRPVPGGELLSAFSTPFVAGRPSGSRRARIRQLVRSATARVAALSAVSSTYATTFSGRLSLRPGGRARRQAAFPVRPLFRRPAVATQVDSGGNVARRLARSGSSGPGWSIVRRSAAVPGVWLRGGSCGSRSCPYRIQGWRALWFRDRLGAGGFVTEPRGKSFVQSPLRDRSIRRRGAVGLCRPQPEVLSSCAGPTPCVARAVCR